MTRIAVIGGTGYAGAHIVSEAVERGHTVVAVSRTLPAERVEGASYVQATLLDVPGLVAELEGVEVVIVSVPGRGDMLGAVRPATAELLASLPDSVRVGIVGGAGGSLAEPGGARVVDGDFPEAAKAESLEAIGVLEDLQTSGTARDWFYIHPAAVFGSFAPGERTGSYRDGGEVLVRDENGVSAISGADFAIAVLDEVEAPKHTRERFAVGY